MDKRFSIGVLDDEPKALELMEHYIKSDSEFSVSFLLDNPVQAMEKAISENVDLMITDIHMPTTNGIWVAQQMIEHNIAVAITSGVWESAHMCINMDIVGFIHKPLTRKGITDILEKFKSLKSLNPSINTSPKTPDLYFIKYANPLTLIAINPLDILFVKGGKDFAEINFIKNSQNKKTLIRITLVEIIKTFHNPYLIQIHKSYIINTQKILKCDYAKVLLEEDVEIPIGPSFRSELFNFLGSKTL
ncbi:LytR/AlgR family response regulator transcription factor [Belliella aquatica]|uniref:DNA-binding response regulator n=1 Tax=Belliella aquatica TaxID=1323734 RepID=A0ABQ1ND83_9BACT|nr:response regulator [Belliella aquatica]MCH7407652.1 response regulator [Belliella aquatica]GGC55206.1 DNA-binding response regulator [Belliella aquatica]